MKLEAELAARLTGVRLVFEIGLDQALYDRAAAAVDARLRAGWNLERFVREVPALYATYLVLVGVFDYCDGGLWPAVHPRLTAFGTSQAGQGFLRALRKLGLEEFDALVEEDNAASYVGRIVAHGGIPVRCLERFLRLLAKEAASGANDAAELIASWRARHAQLDMLHQPARRFTLYGGATAVDLVGRCLDLVRDPDAEDPGLPAYIVDAARRLPLAQQRKARSASASLRVPPPVVRIDPYDSLGPIISLPPVAQALRDGDWRVQDGRGPIRQAATSLMSTTVRTAPARTFEVRYERFDGLSRRWTFEALDRVPALLFDPESGEALRDPTTITREDVWVLARDNVKITAVGRDGAEAALREIQDFPSPTGRWEGFALRHLDLAGVRSLQIGCARVVVVAGRPQPTLVGAPVAGVATADGLPVYSRMPALVLPELPALGGWRIMLRRHRGPTTVLDSGEPLPGGEGRYSLTVRGPLGSDFRSSFAVIEGLEVDRPDHVLLPDERPASVRARATRARLGGAPADTWVELVADDDGAIATTIADVGDDEPIELHVQVPRVLWAIVHVGKSTLQPAATCVRVGAEEFEDELADLLTVRTGRPGVRLQLELLDGKRKLHASRQVLTGGDDGRWSFDLAEFAGHIRSSNAGVLHLELRVGAVGVVVAEIVAQLVISRLTHTARVADDFTSVVLTFEQDRPVQGRVARLWSMDRPWDAPVEERVPEGKTTVELRGYGRIPPGPYLAEIAIADTWVRPRRPAENSPDVRQVRVGTGDDVQRRRAALDPKEPLTALEWAIAGYPGEPQITGAQLAECALEAATALRCLIDGLGAGAPSPRPLRRLLQLVSSDPSVLAHVLLSGAEEGELEPRHTFRLGLRLATAPADLSSIGDAEARALWEVTPLVAGAFDIPAAAAGQTSAIERCRALLGWAPGKRLDGRGGRVERRDLARGVEGLQMVRRTLDLRPPRLLDGEALQEATFEWLIGVLEELEHGDNDDLGGSLSTWISAYSGLRRTQPSRGTDAFRRHIECRRPDQGMPSWAEFPLVSLMAAMHHVHNSSAAGTALTALERAAEFAPALVQHDVLLALTLVHDKEAA